LKLFQADTEEWKFVRQRVLIRVTIGRSKNMAAFVLEDWNGNPVRAARSRGGVTAFPEYRDNLIQVSSCVWPPSELVQKLCRSDRVSAFLPEDQAILSEKLGYYSDLQSVHSEDAMQWNYFGSLVYGKPSERVEFSNWIADLLGIPARNRECTMALWRRIPHPDTFGNGGPELDLMITGDALAIIVESKWRSGEGQWQGMAGNQSQLQLRRQFLANSGRRLLGPRHCVLLYVILDPSQQRSLSPEPTEIPTFCCQWADLCDWPGHPHSDEVRRHYEWKRNLISRPPGVPAPGRQIVLSCSPAANPTLGGIMPPRSA
jgi:hypothetical protein